MPFTILLAGGAGYVGSHVAAELLAAGLQVMVLDNLSTGHAEALRRVGELGFGRPEMIHGDVRDPGALDRALGTRRVDAVIHLAGVKSVSESVLAPEDYFDINLTGSIALFRAMLRHDVRRLIFSSSATVYDPAGEPPFREDAALAVSNPYGRTKLMCERMIDDLACAHPDLRAISLRYFNPVGAHPSGAIGEDPSGPPANLFPYIAQTAAGRRSRLRIFGDDWPTPDGTGIRDFIHVGDLARGHRAAIEHLLDGGGESGRNLKVNLGRGEGCSVLEAAEAFRRASGREIPVEIAPRRPGDVAVSVADASRAAELFGWRARRGLEEMCRDHWRWQSLNPQGFAASAGGEFLRWGPWGPERGRLWGTE